MNVLKVLLIFIVAPFFLVMCKSPAERMAQNASGPSNTVDRFPTSESVDAKKMTSDKMAELAGYISLHFADQGNIKNETLKRFVASSKYYIKNYPNRPEYVVGLYQIYKQVLADKTVNFFMDDDAEFKIAYKGSLKNISDAYKDLDAMAVSLAATTKDKVNYDLLAGVSVTYLRFFTNKISASLLSLAPVSSADRNYVQLRNYFVSVQRAVAVLSTIKDAQRLKNRVGQILSSAEWKNYQALARRTYVGLSESSEVDGTAGELEKAESITIGHKALQVLFQNIIADRSVASVGEKFNFVYPPESMVILDRTPFAFNEEPVRVVKPVVAAAVVKPVVDAKSLAEVKAPGDGESGLSASESVEGTTAAKPSAEGDDEKPVAVKEEKHEEAKTENTKSESAKSENAKTESVNADTAKDVADAKSDAKPTVEMKPVVSAVAVVKPATVPKPAVRFRPRKPASTEFADTVLIGNIPGQYLNQNKNEVYFGAIEIKGRLITTIQRLDMDSLAFFIKSQKDKKVILLKNDKGATAGVTCSSCQLDYDVIYPGFINLHNHTKQNNLPVWGLAKGQFLNRFEWRDWDSYTKSVSQNMNPWIQYGKPIECAAFRWSEMQAMINGTTYLQGPSVCVDKWGVKRVEDKDSYVSEKSAIQAPTDILSPNEMVFVWKTLKPIIDTGKTYEQALALTVQNYCPSLAALITPENVNLPAGLKILTDQEKLEASCGKEAGKPLPTKFVRYIYWIHSGIAGKKRFLKDPKTSAVIAHLAEGNRTDAYNNKEYEVLKLLGLNLPHINFVHGVGIEAKNYAELAKDQIGLVWSPFSNLILYGETLDIKAAHQAGVTIALGSDWLPTGSKGILEEVKLAAQYIDRNESNGYKQIFTDEYLFKMMTENPAKLINHSDISEKEAAVGRLQVGAMGSMAVATLMNANPYTNVVRNVTEKDINLVVVDGQPIYGNKNYLDQIHETYEMISDLDTVIEDSPAFSFTDVETLETLPVAEKAEKKLYEISKFANEAKFPRNSKCDFKVQKGFVNQDTLYFQRELSYFMKNTNLNLDRFSDIQKILAANVLNQSLNKISKDGDRSYAVTYFPSLYSCNDEKHLKRFTNYVKASGDDELKYNIDTRADIRKPLSGKGPAALAEMYK